MLLFTWSNLMTQLQHFFEWTFCLMDGPNRNMNILFIIIGIVGVSYWLWRQTEYNKEAEQNRTIK